MPYNHGGSCGERSWGESMKPFIWSMMIAVAALLPLGAQAQQHTLDVVKKRDKLLCGVNGDAPGFSMENAAKEWSGLDVDLCRAIAAATLGSASKVQFIPTTAQDRFGRLIAGEFDVLVRNSTINLERTVRTKVRFAAVNYYDGQAFVVPKSLGASSLADLRDKIICVIKGTDHDYNMGAWFKARNIQFITRPVDKPDDMYKALFEESGRCFRPRRRTPRRWPPRSWRAARRPTTSCCATSSRRSHSAPTCATAIQAGSTWCAGPSTPCSRRRSAASARPTSTTR